MIKVRYERVKQDEREWVHELVADTGDVIISSFKFDLKKPFTHNDTTLIDDGFSGILYDPMDSWYNVVEVYDKEKNLKGYYSDIRTPLKRIEGGYKALDLLLDVWTEPDLDYMILDMDEFKESTLRSDYKKRALETLDHIIQLIENDRFPPTWMKEAKKLHLKSCTTG